MEMFNDDILLLVFGSCNIFFGFLLFLKEQKYHAAIVVLRQVLIDGS